MRLTTVILLSTCLHVAAAGRAQTVTISLKDVPIQKVFQEVALQAGISIVYYDAYFKETRKVSVNVKDATALDVVKQCLSGLPFTYSQEGTSIVIKPLTVDLQSTAPPSPSLTPPPPVTGTVRGPDGQPLAGVNVVIKGSKKGTVTDKDGKFSINANVGDRLLISSIGYTSQEVIVSYEQQVLIRLAVSTSPLDEVQIIAYGHTSKRISTGNVSTVKAKDIERQPVSNSLLALQGRIPGIVIEQATGLPNSGMTVRIQGQNSLIKGSDPLYVIDGVPISSNMPNSLALILEGTATPNPLNFLNPSDIESIDVLKDADATSIYGSRAAAGAVIITTKRGKTGEIRLDLNVQQGIGQVTRRMDMMNTEQYLEMRKEAYKNDGLPVPTTSSTADWSNADLVHWDPSRYTDWQDKLIGSAAEYTKVGTNVSGGTTQTQYLIGVGYNRQTTVFPGDLADQKGSVHFNINSVSPNRRFKLQFSGNYQLDNNKIINNDLTPSAVQMSPNAPSKLYNEDGSLNWDIMPNGEAAWKNPLAYLKQTLHINTKNLISSLVLDYQLLKGLTLKTNIGYTNMQIDEERLIPLSSKLPQYRMFYNNETDRVANNVNSLIIEPQANFVRNIGRGTLDVLMGGTYQQNRANSLGVKAYGFSSELAMRNLAIAPYRNVSTSSSEYRYSGLFTRINYNLDHKYILNLTARRDGSSRFGPENMFHNFGSIAGAWVFSSENFIKDNLLAISFGKLKLSYGSTGNDQVGDYQYLSLYDNVYSDLPYQGIIGLEPGNLPNPYIQWELTRKTSLGLDVGFWNDRLLVSAVYFRNRSSNQLLAYTLPDMTGKQNIMANLDALIQNSGGEFIVNTVNISKPHFKWSSTLSLTLNRNKLLEFPDLESSSYATTYVVGKPFTVGKYYHFIGVDPKSGLYMVADKNGNPTAQPVPGWQPNSDATQLIDLTQSFYGGIQNTFSFKGFEFQVLLQFAKQQALAPVFSIGTDPGKFAAVSERGNQPVWILDRWRQPNDRASIQKYSTGDQDGLARYNANISDAAFDDASYVRLKNISLSWQLPEKWQHTIRLDNARLFIIGQNMFTITNYRGLDPETKSWSVLPPLRIIVAGVQIGL